MMYYLLLNTTIIVQCGSHNNCMITYNETLILLQFQQDVIKSIFPAERDTYVKLTALMAQVQSLYLHIVLHTISV